MKPIQLTSQINNDEYTEYVYNTFDIQNRDVTTVIIPLDFSICKDMEWNVGVIYGGSGSGKTSVLKRFGGVREAIFDKDKPLISNFHWMLPKEAARLLMSIGLSSVPTWLRPYHTLSNGEQYRATLAYLVASAAECEVILIDEYTSVVDRDVAKAMSFALQKYIRKTNKQIILASCHYDIMEWLMPDWVYSPTKGVAEKYESLRQRPPIELNIYRVEHDSWNLFKKHHYLTEDVSKSCKFFLFTWNNKPIGINAVIAQPSGYFQNGVRESRIVILPEYQGMGLGSLISEFIAAIYMQSGFRYFTKTVHPALGEYRNIKKDKWKGTRKNGKSEKDQNAMGKIGNWKVMVRTSYCHEYIGEPIAGFEHLLKPVDELRRDKANI